MKVSNEWKVKESDSGWYAIFDSDEDQTQLTEGGCGCCSRFGDCVEHELVARLMAAAPELLRALRRCVGPDPEGVDLLCLFDDIEFKED